MKPKSGKKIKAVQPAKPDVAEEADEADPGKVDQVKAKQIEQGKGKYGAVKVPAHQPPEPGKSDETKTSWIELEMIDESDEPVPGVAYLVTLPDGTESRGTLDNNGFARIEGFEPGQCEVTFPELDKSAWEKA